MIAAGQSDIIEYSLSLVKVSVSDEIQGRNTLATVLHQFINKKTTFDESKSQFISLLGTSRPIDVLNEIIEESKDGNPLAPIAFAKKTPRHWTSHEDLRLLAGVYIYGSSDWSSISKFVGSGRSRAQCLQRWNRTLSPNVKKDIWTKEEDEKLCRIVGCSDKLSWTNVSHQMGNRSDVQCRYHFSQLLKNNKIEYRTAKIIGTYGREIVKKVPFLVDTAQVQMHEIPQHQQQNFVKQEVVMPVSFSYPQQAIFPIPGYFVAVPTFETQNIDQPFLIDQFLSCFSN